MVKENLEEFTPHYCYNAFRFLFPKKKTTHTSSTKLGLPLYIMQLVAQPTESGHGLFLFARQYLSDWTLLANHQGPTIWSQTIYGPVWFVRFLKRRMSWCVEFYMISKYKNVCYILTSCLFLLSKKHVNFIKGFLYVIHVRETKEIFQEILPKEIFPIKLYTK
jgi:hypothetical protein